MTSNSGKGRSSGPIHRPQISSAADSAAAGSSLAIIVAVSEIGDRHSPIIIW